MISRFFNNVIIKHKSIFLISISAAIFVASLNQYMLILLAFLLVLFGITLIGKDYLIPFSIILYISFTGEYLLQFRGFLAAGLILVLSYLFFQRYGFKIKDYPTMPSIFLAFAIIYYLALIISQFYNGFNLVSLLATLRVIYFSIVFYIIFSFINDVKSIFRFSYTLIMSSTIISMVIFYEFLQSSFKDFLVGGILYRYAGLYSNPNDAALLFIVSLLLSIAILFTNKNMNLKRIIIFTLIINSFGLFLTNSRASIMALIIALFISF